jgi:drug/metabolite transporter (DMT)-like permease
MELWFAITLVAAFLQNARSLLQKRLTGDLSINGASYVRFFYAVPFAWAYGLWLWQGSPEGFNVAFFVYVTMGAIAQIVATSCLLASFTIENFAIGTAYSKSEAAQAALVGLILLGDSVDAWVLVGIAVSLVGVLLLSGNVGLRDLLRPNRAMWLGIAAGTGFAISAVGFRGASLALEGGSYLQRAGLTVMVSVTLQMLLMGGFLAVREPRQIGKVIRAWRVAIWVGAIGMVASVGWFTAMTLKNAAVVRAVGQVELLFTVASSIWLLGERVTRREVIGMTLVVAGIWLLI